MEIFIVRHGAAVEIGEKGVTTDSSRMLSEEGREKTRMVAKALVAAGVEIDRFVSSPLVRAVETAEIFAEVFCGRSKSNSSKNERESKTRVKVEILEHLKPSGSRDAIVDWLARQSDCRIALFGHSPDVSELASLLLAGKEWLSMPFKKSAVAAISFTDTIAPGSGTLEWFLPPKFAKLIKT